MDNKKDNKEVDILHLIALSNMIITECKKEDVSSILENNPGSYYIGPIKSH